MQATEETHVLTKALELAAQGFHVLPCRPGRKLPWTDHGVHDAACSEKRVRALFEGKPAANLAIRCGTPGRADTMLLVVDIDPRNDGAVSWATLIAGRPLPDTRMCRTGSGGTHIYLLAPSGMRLPKQLAHGVDIQGPGRYVVAPPSIHENGEPYEWESEAPIAMCPIWLVGELEAAAGRRPEPSAEGPAPDAFVEGGRNNALTAMAGYMRRKGLTADEMLPSLLVLNQTRCRPPLEDQEVTTIARSIGRASAADPLRPEPTPGPAPEIPEGHPLALVPELARIALYGAARVRQMAAKPVPYIWQDIATSAQIVALSGQPGGGKTTLLFLCLVARANGGRPINLLGRTMLAAPPGKFIVLIEAEQSEGSTSRKLVRAAEALGVGDEGIDRIITIARKQVLVGSPRWEDIKTLIRAGYVSDVGIDTLARVAPGDANDEQVQAAIFSALQEVIESAPGDEEDKPIVWLSAHSKKAGEGQSVEDMSGSQQRGAQVDTMLSVVPKRQDGRVVASKVYFVKLREDPDVPPDPFEFTFTRVNNRWAVLRGEEVQGTPEERVVSYLEMFGPTAKTTLRDKLGLHMDMLERVLSDLFAAKAIRTEDAVVNGRPRKRIRLREDRSGAPDKASDRGGNGYRPDTYPVDGARWRDD